MPRMKLAKGSPEAKAWGRKMKRLRKTIRKAGRKTEKEFFGAGGPLEVRNPGTKWHEGMATVSGRYKRGAQSSLQKHFFAGMEQAHTDSASAAKKLGMNPVQYVKSKAKTIQAFVKEYFGTTGTITGSSSLQSGGPTMLKVSLHGLGLAWIGYDYDKQAYVVVHKHFKKNPIAVYNPPAPVAGVIYNNAIEIRARKTNRLHGKYKHVFGKNVQILGLKDGTVLLRNTKGKRLWISRKEYDRTGGRHSA